MKNFTPPAALLATAILVASLAALVAFLRPTIADVEAAKLRVGMTQAEAAQALGKPPGVGAMGWGLDGSHLFIDYGGDPPRVVAVRVRRAGILYRLRMLWPF